MRSHIEMRLHHGLYLFHHVDAIVGGRQDWLLRFDQQQQIGNHMLKTGTGLTQLRGVAFDVLLAGTAPFHNVRQLFQ